MDYRMTLDLIPDLSDGFVLFLSLCFYIFSVRALFYRDDVIPVLGVGLLLNRTVPPPRFCCIEVPGMSVDQKRRSQFTVLS